MDKIENNYYTDDDDADAINLLDLIIVLLKYKLLICIITVLGTLLGVIYSLNKQNIYSAETTIIPRSDDKSRIPASLTSGFGALIASNIGLGGNQSLEKLQATIKSNDFAIQFLSNYNLVPLVTPYKWDEEKKTLAPIKEITFSAKLRVFKKQFDVNSDIKAGTLKITFEYKNPKFAKKILEYYLKQLSEILRTKMLQEAKDNQWFLNEQLKVTNDALLREKIYSLLSTEIEKEVFAKAQKYYSFDVIDPPFAPDEKIKPKRGQICIVFLILFFILGIFLAFILESIEKNKNDERYIKLKENLLRFNIK